MIPDKANPAWKKIVTETPLPELSSLATKMMVMRVRTMTKFDQSPAKVNEAINVAYEFFVKNEALTVNDQRILFGK